ncbi:hypothetical protein H0H93_005651 [Arthromyces matolae]|nr:hypothetical protein H0H93_005651 [Arthromyces matolae]
MSPMVWNTHIPQVEKLPRLEPALTSTKNGIRTMIWAEDALNLSLQTNSYPGFRAFEMIVPARDVLNAAEYIMEEHSYDPTSGRLDGYIDRLRLDPEESRMYPDSVCLTSIPATRKPSDGISWEELPEFIFIHPDSFWGLDVNDDSKSTLIPPYRNARLPTLATMINTIMKMNFDPPSGYLHSRLYDKLGSWLDDLWTHAFPKDNADRDGTLSTKEQEVMKDISPENQPYFERISRYGNRAIEEEHRAERRSILRKLG